MLDGDTLVINARNWLGQVVSTKVRLAGVDAPELRGRCARESRMARNARSFVGKLAGQVVTLRDIRYGKFAGQVIARDFTAEGEELGQALIAAGLARSYRINRRTSSRSDWVVPSEYIRPSNAATCSCRRVTSHGANH